MRLPYQVLLICMLLPSVATAAAPTWRWLTVDQGLDPEHVSATTQTPDGRLWIATQAGVFQWDGVRVRRADAGKVRDWVHDLVALPSGAVAARCQYGSLWWIDGDNARRQPGPGGTEEGFSDIWRNADGELVALHQGGLYVWRAEQWHSLASSEQTKGAYTVRDGPKGSLLLGSNSQWVTWHPEGMTDFAPGASGRTWDATTGSDGTVWLLDQPRAIRHVTSTGQLIETISIPKEARDLEVRDDQLWWVDDAHLHRLRRGPIGAGRRDSFMIPGMGNIFVDDEGSVWLGTQRGLGQISDPDALELTADREFPRLAGRSISTTAKSVWMGAWQGAVRHNRASGETEFLGEPVTTSPVCAGRDDIGWGVTRAIDGVRHRVAMGGQPTRFLASWPSPGASYWDSCDVASDGTVWWMSANQLWRTTGLEPPQALAVLPFSKPPDWLQILRIQQGYVWVSTRGEACGIRESALIAAPQDADWSCYALPGGGSVRDLVITEAGNVWATGSKMGLLRLQNGQFQPHPGEISLPTPKVYALRPSPRGGVWVLGPSVSMRVTDHPDAPLGWRVEETLSDRLGRLVNEPAAVAEDVDGTLWFSGVSGLVTVPSSVRQERFEPPPVLLADVMVDGQAMPKANIALPRPTSHLRLRFVSPSYKAPKLLRYRMQLDDRPPTISERVAQFDFAQLGAGQHAVSVWASLDGERWSPEPAVIAITVPQPWFARWQTWAALITVFGMAVVAIMMIRHRVQLGVETLRTRIALDLHDEVGAGLASVGLLGGLLHDDLPADTRQQIAGRLVGTSKELGGALRAIVWSLRPTSLRLGELGAYLEDRARGVFGELDLQDTLEIRRPLDSNTTALGLDVLRAVQLVSLEALHNAAKHANATRVTLTLEPAGRDRWRMTVEDNGTGIVDRERTSVDSGNGLESMARRAAEIGAKFDITTGAMGGTRISMEFSPRARRSKK